VRGAQFAPSSREAHGCPIVSRAKRLLTSLVRRPRDAHPGPAASVEESLGRQIPKLGLPTIGIFKSRERSLNFRPRWCFAGHESHFWTARSENHLATS
jgi:hypothetical protein